MLRTLSASVAGAIFGLGIALSGMGNPAKVMNFFDPFGTWDASLAFVMAAALLTTAIGYALIPGRRPAPVLDSRFHLPTSRDIDVRLIGGSALFGLGWEITGFCPGGAIPILGVQPWPTALFVMSMLAGILLARAMQMHSRRLFA